MEKKKTELIGVTREPQTISQEEFDSIVKEAVYKPLENSNALSVCICRKCGTYGEVPKEYVSGLIRTMMLLGQYPKVSLENKEEMRMNYFVTGSCEICHQKGEPVYVKMEKIDFEV